MLGVKFRDVRLSILEMIESLIECGFINDLRKNKKSRAEVF